MLRTTTISTLRNRTPAILGIDLPKPCKWYQWVRHMGRGPTIQGRKNATDAVSKQIIEREGICLNRYVS